MIKYPVYKPDLKGKEKEYVMDCLESTWISSRGKYVDAFERKIEEYTGVKHAISIHNGTVAIHLALIAAGIGPGDEVIVPDFTYVATASTVIHAGATPVLADIRKDNWNIDIASVQSKITKKTKAIIAVDIYGVPANYDELNTLAKQHGLILIEDAAESLGATYSGKAAGNLADLATFSFFGNKTITTGEGGMLLTNNDEYASLARKIKNQGNSENIRYYHDVLGYNYRMTNIQAAIGLAQMEKVHEIVSRKREIYTIYYNQLKDVVTFQTFPAGTEPSFWMVSFLLENESARNNLMIYLENKGIETRPFFMPLHNMPFLPQTPNATTMNISGRGINVPSYPSLTDEEINFISGHIIHFLKNNPT